MFYNFWLKYVILSISKNGEDTSPGGFTSLVGFHVAIYTINHLIMVVGSLIKCYTLGINSDCSIYSQLVLLYTLLFIWFCTIFTIDIRSIFFNGCLTTLQFTTISIDSSLFLIFCSVTYLSFPCISKSIILLLHIQIDPNSFSFLNVTSGMMLFSQN